MLPFTTEAFFAVFEQYNLAIWPAQIVAYALGLAAVLLALRPVQGSDRMIGGILVAAWLWNGIVYHYLHFAAINIAAPLFGAVFVLQGLLLGWTTVLRGRPTFRFRPDAYGWIGLGAAVFAMIVYPLVGWLLGHGWPRAPMFGVAPCPMTIFTLGLLLMSEGRTPLLLLVIPLLWSLAGGSAAWLLEVPQDLALPLAGLGGLWLILRKNRRSPAH